MPKEGEAFHKKTVPSQIKLRVEFACGRRVWLKKSVMGSELISRTLSVEVIKKFSFYRYLFRNSGKKLRQFWPPKHQ